VKIPDILKGSTYAGEPFETMSHERVLEVLAHVLEQQRREREETQRQYGVLASMRSARVGA